MALGKAIHRLMPEIRISQFDKTDVHEDFRVRVSTETQPGWPQNQKAIQLRNCPWLLSVTAGPSYLNLLLPFIIMYLHLTQKC